MRTPVNLALGSLQKLLTWRQRHLTIGAFLAALLLTCIGPSQATLALTSGPAPAFGLDISWPQCKVGIPSPDSGRTLTVIGVTGGRAFTRNPCFANEYTWSLQQGHAPSFYINLNYPARATASHGQSGPAGKCPSSGAACQAFNYGYNAAQDAVAYARSISARSSTWWLDIEMANYWSKDPTLNARVIRGAINYFQSHGLTVGIYSIAPMWREIAGSFSPGLPIWVAQSESWVPALAYCASTYAFAGGTAVMVQSWNGTFDVDFGCPGENALVPANVSNVAGSASAPYPLETSATDTLAGNQGGASVYYSFPNSGDGAQQTVTINFWPFGPDTANAVFATLYQNDVKLAEVHATNATTPGTLSLVFSSPSSEPFVIRLTSYNDPTAEPIHYTIRRS
jgi:hypothetical protein